MPLGFFLILQIRICFEKPFSEQFTVGIRPRLTGIVLMPHLMQYSIDIA
jgi:hypothetical protein